MPNARVALEIFAKTFRDSRSLLILHTETQAYTLAFFRGCYSSNGLNACAYITFFFSVFRVITELSRPIRTGRKRYNPGYRLAILFGLPVRFAFDFFFDQLDIARGLSSRGKVLGKSWKLFDAKSANGKVSPRGNRRRRIEKSRQVSSSRTAHSVTVRCLLNNFREKS